MKNYADLTVIVPAYNEGLSVRATLEELRKTLPDASIIVVNDGSTDNTQAEISKVQNIVLINHENNRGMGAALKAGMRAAQTRCLAWYDADGQHRCEDLIKIVEPVLSGRKDVVIGVRDRDSNQQLERLPGKFILKWFIESMAEQKIPDFNSGLRCFRKDVINRYLHLLPDGFSASTTSTLLMINRGYNIGYEPVTALKRKGKSSLRMRDGFVTLHMILRTAILFKAFRFFLALSILQILPGILYGFCVAVTRGKGFPVLASLAVTSGVLTFFMGIIADQIVELRKEKFEN